ncbi:hypothetical protein [uncultured Paludibaculum sp.]|uniref:hypothetical protein n=1 Tax=uncultured Paludibaculum sp. TaxID=1765020 RepID=UPI002AAC1E8B|nr:hypothetical protein [uncultured Paludibaculum sp.]
MSTLVWDGNDLVDVTSNQRIRPDGSVTRQQFGLGYDFDRAVCIRRADTFWAVAYDNRGTAAALMKNGRFHRQLNRDFNHAADFDYPITLADRGSGHIAIIHCPRSYDTLEFEDAETGEILDVKRTDEMEFHSRLSISPNGRFLLSAGWFWHPLCGVWICPLRQAQEDTPQPEELGFSYGAEFDSAAFLDNDSIVLTTATEVVNDAIPSTGLGPLKLGVWSIQRRRWTSIVDLMECSGMIMPWRDWIISFHGHPKAIQLSTGAVVHRWDQLYSGRQVGAIDLGDPPPPQIALDSQGGRFAVSGPEGVTVVNLSTTDCGPAR